MATTTKKELINRIAEETGAKQVLVKTMVHQFFSEIITELEQGNRLELRDFGVFETKVAAPRTAQNPKTLQKVHVPAKRRVVFKPGRLMRQGVNGHKPAKTSPTQVRSAAKVIRLPRRTFPAGRGLEARVYSAEVLFRQQRPPLAQFARDLNIVPELVPEIEEDSGGTRGTLEIWFQEINGQKLTLNIQRAHFKRKETYVRDLENFLGDIETLTYVEQVQIERQ